MSKSLTLGQLIDMALKPLTHNFHLLVLRYKIDSADKSADVEFKASEQARQSGLYFQKKAMQLRSELADLEAKKVPKPDDSAQI